MSTSRRHTEPMVLRIAKAVAEYIGFGGEDFPERATKPAVSKQKPLAQTQKPSLRLLPATAPSEQHPGHKWRRHAQLRAYQAPISDVVRESRHAAVRGLFAAREGALDVATEHFSVAAKCEEVDLTAVPGFWQLTRGQMQTAVNAYETAGRYRDAAALDAHIASIFRPSLVGAKTAPILPRRQQHKAANT